MKRIFINGLNAKSGGGKSILTNYLSILCQKQDISDKYFVLTADKREYKKYESDNLKIVDVKSIYKKHVFLAYTYQFIIPKLLKKLKIDVVFNPADIPIVTTTHQVFLFDWPYAVYPESKVWKMMDIKSLFTRKMKLFLFKRNIKHINQIIAQNEAMKNRLEKLYDIKNIKIVPNAVSLDNLSGGEKIDFKLPKGKKLLYLTHYYPHKNIEIFLPLAQDIKNKNLDYKLIITIDENQHKDAKKLLEDIKIKGLDDVIINVGSVKMEYVPELYKQTDGLMMPTLLESFSGTYVEAMFHKRVIFTSNFDFAEVVCKDAAFYFDPFDPVDILKKMEQAFANDEYLKKIEEGTKRLSQLPTWEETFELYQQLICNSKN